MNEITPIKNVNMNPNFIKKNRPDSTSIEQSTISDTIKNNLKQHAILGQAQVNFKGRFSGKFNGFNLNPKDILFLTTLATSFGLSPVYLDKLKSTLSRYLQDRNYKSMSDIGGENNIVYQSEVAEALRKAMDIDENDTDKLTFLTDKIIERCESGECYFPENNNFEKAMQEKKAEEEFWAGLIKYKVKREKEKDEKFIDAVSRTFRLDDIQKNRLKRIINDILIDNNLTNMKDAYGHDDYFEIIAIINSAIEQEFNLSDYESMLVGKEIIERLESGKNYIPTINPLDRNEKIASKNRAIFNEILNKYKIDLLSQKQLYIAMKQDAYENGYTSIFDLFNKGKSIEQFPATESILNSKAFNNLKTDLIIDFNLADKKSDKILKEREKRNSAFEAKALQASAIVCMLDEKFNLSKQDLMKIRHYLTVEKFNFNEDSDIWKAAYEISEMHNLNCKKMANIIKITNRMNSKEMDEYAFKYCQLLISKS